MIGGRPLISMREALADPELLAGVLHSESWQAWRILLIAMMGEALDDEERVIFKRLTDREREPLARVEEFWGIVGRRGGKSRSAAVLAIYLATMVDYSDVLALGERPVVLMLAQTAIQARIVLGYAVGVVRSISMFGAEVQSETAESVTLKSGVVLEVRPASFRGLRGVTCLAVVADEVAFWYGEDSSVNPDSEILDAVRPGLGTTGGPLIVISSPYGRKGEVYKAWKDHWGEKGDKLILVARGATRDLNPSYPQYKIDRAFARDPAWARSEFLAEFRTDLEPYISIELVESLTDDGIVVRPRKSGVNYRAFVDAAGGSGQDSFSAGIAHREGERSVLDCVFEARPIFNPQTVIAEVGALLKSYGISSCVGDKWAQGFVAEGFTRNGIIYRASEEDRSQIYLNALPLFTAGRARLVDNRKMALQFASLNRRTAPGGRDTVFHPTKQRAHDDLCNAAAGALVLAAAGSSVPVISNDLMNWSRRPMQRAGRYY